MNSNLIGGDIFMDFLRNIRWGIGKNEVHAIFRDIEFVGEHPEQNAIGFYDSIHGADAGIVSYFNRGVFGKDKLARVTVTFFKERPEDEIIEKTYAQIKSDLMDEYGRPTDEVDYSKGVPDDLRLSEMLVWAFGDSILTLSLGLNRDGVLDDAPCISVGFGNRKTDPVSKQWDWLQ